MHNNWSGIVGLSWPSG